MVSEQTIASSCHCFYCGSPSLKPAFEKVFHRYKPGYGPFDIYECPACGSGITYPMPTPEQLTALYEGYTNGLPEDTREAMGPDGGELWHPTCVKRLGVLNQLTPESRFTWIETGAGAGEMARLMAAAYPCSTGLATDLHARPESLPANVEWMQVDLSSPTFHEIIGRKADIVYATAVWEHVSRPDLFVENMVRMLGENGLLYLVTPNYGSVARKLLGMKWPYLNPGEHLTMPSLGGARLCLRQALRKAGLPDSPVSCHPVCLMYSLFYTVKRFGLPFANVIPRSWKMPMPSGALECFVRLSENRQDS